MSGANVVAFQQHKEHVRHPFLDQVLHVPIQDLIVSRDVFVLECSNSIRQALAALGARRILSAPVLSSSGAVLGFVDYFDIVSYLISKSNGNLAEVIEHMSDRLDAVSGQSHRNPFIQLNGRTLAIVVVEIFASGIHRCAIFDENFGVTSLVSQSDMVRFIRKQLKFPQMREFASMTVSDVAWGGRKVITIQSECSVVDALETLKRFNVSAVAIINNRENHLIGNFSLSDLRGLTDNDLSLLSLSVEKFLRKRSPASLKVISCTNSTTVATVLETLADEQLHRLWVVDSNCFPVGLVTMTDVMNLVLDFSPKRQLHILDIPGVLQISVLKARNLTSASWLSKPYVVTKIPGIKQAQFATPPSDSFDEASWYNQTFMVEVDESVAQEVLLFMVKGRKLYGGDEDLGYLTVAFSWVLSGFGTGVHCLEVQDWFSLKKRDSGQLTLGQLQLRFKYSPFVQVA